MRPPVLQLQLIRTEATSAIHTHQSLPPDLLGIRAIHKHVVARFQLLITQPASIVGVKAMPTSAIRCPNPLSGGQPNEELHLRRSPILPYALGTLKARAALVQHQIRRFGRVDSVLCPLKLRLER